MSNREFLPRDTHHHFSEAVDSHHFFGPDVHWPREVRFHQPSNSFNAFINMKEGSSLLSIAPYLDLTTIRRLRNFSADRRWRFFFSAAPSPFWPEDIMESRDVYLYSVI